MKKTKIGEKIKIGKDLIKRGELPTRAKIDAEKLKQESDIFDGVLWS